jgi:hypothetical protein
MVFFRLGLLSSCKFSMEFALCQKDLPVFYMHGLFLEILLWQSCWYPRICKEQIHCVVCSWICWSSCLKVDSVYAGWRFLIDVAMESC